MSANNVAPEEVAFRISLESTMGWKSVGWLVLSFLIYTLSGVLGGKIGTGSKKPSIRPGDNRAGASTNLQVSIPKFSNSLTKQDDQIIISNLNNWVLSNNGKTECVPSFMIPKASQ